MTALRRPSPLCLFLLAIITLLFSGCAIMPHPTPSFHVGEGGIAGDCADFFSTLDRRVVEAKALDPGAFRPEGFPYLRVDRFLASFRREVSGPPAFAAWVEQMQSLDREAREHEIANLPPSLPPLAADAGDRAAVVRRVSTCGDLLRAVDFANSAGQEQLRKRAVAPDEYLDLRRILGLYPLAYPFIYQGVMNWHAETRKTFTNEAPAGWKKVRYVPAPVNGLPTVRQIATATERDALGIPRYTPEAREALFHTYAPVWEVQTEGADDRPGTPYWTAGGEIAIRIQEPVTFTLLSFTRFGQEILTQLNYVIWFPARTKPHACDLYGGKLDGVNYRVTLDRDGEPLLYETVHNCGCYYTAYPTRRLTVRENIDYAEPPLILKAPERASSTSVMAIALESRTHYVQHLYLMSQVLTPGGVSYGMEAYGRLRQLPHTQGGRKSLFGQDSLVPGTQRLERFVIWPSGVLSPGAMRQWGRHAVAFVGKRHFDDPFYMEEMFERAAGE